MKLRLLVLFLGVSTGVFARNDAPTVLKTRIINDEKTLSIQIDGLKNGRKIHYDQTFPVAAANQLQKEVLKYRAFRSVGLVLPPHEMPGLFLMSLGGVGLLAVALTGMLNRRKAALTNPVNSLRSE